MDPHIPRNGIAMRLEAIGWENHHGRTVASCYDRQHNNMDVDVVEALVQMVEEIVMMACPDSLTESGSTTILLYHNSPPVDLFIP